MSSLMILDRNIVSHQRRKMSNMRKVGYLDVGTMMLRIAGMELITFGGQENGPGKELKYKRTWESSRRE
jgi:hypothetical protein